MPENATSLVNSSLVVKLRRYQVATPHIETTNSNPYQRGGYDAINISTIPHHFALSKDFHPNIVGHNDSIVPLTILQVIPILVMEVQQKSVLLLEFLLV